MQAGRGLYDVAPQKKRNDRAVASDTPRRAPTTAPKTRGKRATFVPIAPSLSSPSAPDGESGDIYYWMDD